MAQTPEEDIAVGPIPITHQIPGYIKAVVIEISTPGFKNTGEISRLCHTFAGRRDTPLINAVSRRYEAGLGMTVSYFVSYNGTTADPDAFADRYAKVHAPILRDFPGIASLTLHRAIDWRDPFAVNPAGIQLLAQMSFPTIEALNAALASDARGRARADLARFPPLKGDVFYQAMKSKVIF